MPTYPPAIAPARQRPCLPWSDRSSWAAACLGASKAQREGLGATRALAFAKQMTKRCQGWFVGSGCPAVWQPDTSQLRCRSAAPLKGSHVRRGSASASPRGEVAFAKQMTERCQGRFVGCGCQSVRQLDTSQSRLRRASSPIVGEPRALPRQRTVGRPDPGRRCRQPEVKSTFVGCSNVRPRRRGGHRVQRRVPDRRKLPANSQPFYLIRPCGPRSFYKQKTPHRPETMGSSACQKSIFDTLSIHAGRGSRGRSALGCAHAKGAHLPDESANSQAHVLTFLLFYLISPPAGGETATRQEPPSAVARCIVLRARSARLPSLGVAAASQMIGFFDSLNSPSSGDDGEFS